MTRGGFQLPSATGLGALQDLLPYTKLSVKLFLSLLFTQWRKGWDIKLTSWVTTQLPGSISLCSCSLLNAEPGPLSHLTSRLVPLHWLPRKEIQEGRWKSRYNDFLNLNGRTARHPATGTDWSVDSVSSCLVQTSFDTEPPGGFFYIVLYLCK